MPIDRRNHRPLYRQLADDLREQIHTDRYQPGASLPAKMDLACAHGVGVPTVRRALAVLRSEGLIDTERSRRPRVRPRTPRRMVALRSGDQVVVRMPSDPQRRQLGWSEAVAIIELDHGAGGSELLSADEVVLVAHPGPPPAVVGQATA